MMFLIPTQKVFFLSLAFLLTFTIGWVFAHNAIPNQEGYFERSWNLTHIDFKKTILTPGVTPINYLFVALLEQVLHISIKSSWLVMDLFFAGLLTAFFCWIYWRQNGFTTIFSKLFPILVTTTSFGFIYPFTSMTGEGPPLFFAATGLYAWSKKRFLLGAILFSLSLLSQYTIYLITPGIFIWTLLHLKTISNSQFKKLIIALIIFLSIFFTYHGIKSWGDIKLQAAYSHGFTLSKPLSNIPYFIIATLVGAPIVVFLCVSTFDIKNVYLLASISATIMLSRHYFYWHYPVQIITFLIMYCFTKPLLLTKPVRILSFQIVLFLCLAFTRPWVLGSTEIYPKPLTISDSRQIDNILLEDSSKMQVGYYLNRRFDENFPNYEISYLNPAWDFIMKDTKYIVVPNAGLPDQVLQYRSCSYTFYKSVFHQSIYKVDCENN